MRRRWTGIVLVALLVVSPVFGAPVESEGGSWWQAAWSELVSKVAAFTLGESEEPVGPIGDPDGVTQTEVEPPEGEVGPIADPNG